MTLKDLADIRKRDFLDRNIIFSIIFAFIFMFITIMLLEWLSGYYTYLKLYQGILYFTATFLFILYIYIYHLLSIPLRKVAAFFTYNFGNNKVFLRIKEKDLSIKEITKNFEFQGVVRDHFEDCRSIYLNWSSEGMITRTYFKDFVLKFKAKIFSHGFAIIIFAKDLENYLMLRIGNDDHGIYIVPHLRKQGIWEIQGIGEERENSVKVAEGEILEFNIKVQKKLIKLEITKSKKIIKSFTYLLPDYFPLLPVKSSDGKPVENVVLKNNLPMYGKIGFRADGDHEKVIIRDLKIERIE